MSRKLYSLNQGLKTSSNRKFSDERQIREISFQIPINSLTNIKFSTKLLKIRQKNSNYHSKSLKHQKISYIISAKVYRIRIVESQRRHSRIEHRATNSGRAYIHYKSCWHKRFNLHNDIKE